MHRLIYRERQGALAFPFTTEWPTYILNGSKMEFIENRSIQLQKVRAERQGKQL